MWIANAAQIREADRIMIEEHAFPGIILMENAARKATDRLISLYPHQTHFLILAGPGNNGGDGLAMARMLHLDGKKVCVLCSHPLEKYQGDALTNFRILSQLPVAVHPFSESLAAEWLLKGAILLDALLGTGISAGLRPPIREIISFFQGKKAEVVAIDLPSGLSADTGQLINPVLAASHTFSFQLPKICHLVSPASEACGQIHVLDIAIWDSVIRRLNIRREMLDEDFVRHHYRPRLAVSHKGIFGHVLVVGGSRQMAGAVAMTALAAVQMGVGLCTVFTLSAARNAVNGLCPEAMCLDVAGDFLDEKAVEAFRKALPGKDAIVLGPGMGNTPESLAFLEKALPEIKLPLLLDADALNLLAANPELQKHLPSSTVLTPHPGEMQRLAPQAEPQSQRLEAAEEMAQKLQATLVLKGKGTLVAQPDGQSRVNSSGNAGLASGGTGDVLSGAIGAFLAQGYGPGEAAGLGVFLHGKAADLLKAKGGEEGISATAVARTLSLALKESLQ